MCLDSIVLHHKEISPDILLKEAYKIGLGLFLWQRLFQTIYMEHNALVSAICTIFTVLEVPFVCDAVCRTNWIIIAPRISPR